MATKKKRKTNPQAKRAMALMTSEGITLKEAWRRVKGGKATTKKKPRKKKRAAPRKKKRAAPRKKKRAAPRKKKRAAPRKKKRAAPRKKRAAPRKKRATSSVSLPSLSF